MAQEAEGREGRGITYKTAVAEGLGCEYAEFDLAYYADTFEVTPHLRRVLEEAARVLKPGGILVHSTAPCCPG